MIVPFGDEALLVVLGETIDPDIARRAHAIVREIHDERAADKGCPWGVAVPSYASVLVPFDASALATTEAIDRLAAVVERADRAVGVAWSDEEQPPLDVPVRYGGDAGPDLGSVAERTGLTPAQVVDAHSSTVYTVYLLGFVPGFAYLGILPPALVLPRRDEPRLRVPKGSVGIAAQQTAVYPFETPGGWHLIGRTETEFWDVRRDPPALLHAGQRVRFVPIRDS